MHVQACSCMNSLYLIVWEWTCTLIAPPIKRVTLRFNFLLLFLSHRRTRFVILRAERARGTDTTNQEGGEKSNQKEEKKKKQTPSRGSPSRQPHHTYLKAETFAILLLRGLKKISLSPDCYRAEYIMQMRQEFMHTQTGAPHYRVYTGEENRQHTTVINN